MGYRKDAIKGIGWIGLLRVATRLSTLLKTAILARLLTPTDFGQFGIVALTLGFFETVTETGVNQVLIQSDRPIHDILDSAWVVAIVRGFAISVLIIIAAQPIASFFSDPTVFPLILLASLIPAVKGFINPMIVNFYKDLKFDQEFKFRGLLLAADLVVSLAVAVATRSALAFIAALFVCGTMEVILSFLWCAVWPKFRYTKTYLAEIVGYGKWVTLAGAGYWLSAQLGDFVTGKLFGTASLGIYQAAYKVSTLPVTEISGTVNQVAFPVMSKVKADKERLIKIFSTTFLSTNAVGIGIALVIFLFPAFVVSIVLGPQWTAAVPILRMLAVFGVLRTIESSMQPLFLAVGKPNVPSIGNLIKVAVLAVGLFLWAPQGLIGVSFAAVVSALAVMPYYIVSVLPVLSR